MSQKPNRAVLFVNGDLPAPEKIRAQLTTDDLLIAVDGGLRHMASMGLVPDLIIGDLDSANPALIQDYSAQGVEIRTFPIDKDETDLEIALDAALDLVLESIWVVAALGGRMDQSLANIFLLTRPDLVEYDVRLVDGLSEVFLIHTSASINGEVGDRVSLLPLSGPATGVHAQGLQFPLENEILYPHKTRGISNQLISPSASIGLQSGLLLCIHETTQMHERRD